MFGRWTRRKPTEKPIDRRPWIRDRLAAIELERLEILADEGVPGRKHRLDALAGAAEDLRAELARLEPEDPLSPPTRCRTAAGSP